MGTKKEKHKVVVGNVYEDNDRTPKRVMKVVSISRQSSTALLDILEGRAPRGPKQTRIQLVKLGNTSKKGYRFLRYEALNGGLTVVPAENLPASTPEPAPVTTPLDMTPATPPTHSTARDPESGLPYAADPNPGPSY